jgi:hypothetical protein
MRFHSRFGPIGPALALAALSLCAGGCGGDDRLPRQAVSGTVSVKGTPLKAGVITFVPESKETPTQGGSPIVDGKYSIPRQQGLVPAKYRIVITSSEDKPEVFPDKGFNNDAPGMAPIPAKQVIPSQYNDKTLLVEEVRAGTNNIFDFDINPSAPASK